MTNWDDRPGHHRATRDRARRKRGIAERHVDLLERHAGLLRGELREDGVRSGADILRAARDARRAVIAKLDAGLGWEAGGQPRAPRHPPAQCQAVALHRADPGRALGPAELLGAELEALEVMA